MRFGFKSDGVVRGHYELHPFPGNGAVCISSGVTIDPYYRGKGLAKIMAEERYAKARELGYKYMIATVRVDNKAEQAELTRASWVELAQICDPDNDVRLYGRLL